MRILHTSDWHLGLELSGHDRLAEQSLFLEWLLERIREEEIDALLVAGDIYDTVNPPVAAQTLLAEFLVKVGKLRPSCQVVAVAGNHDSAVRLEIPRAFGRALGGIHLVGSFQPGVASRHRILLRDAGDRPAAWCLAVPFLRSSDLPCRPVEGESPQEAFERAYALALQEMVGECRKEHPGLPIVGMGHLTLSGAQRAGSERLLLGGVEGIPVGSIAEGFDYVALGHIHRRQGWCEGRVRYSGSPLPVDLDEVSRDQSVVVVDLPPEAGGGLSVRELNTPRPVPILRLPREPGTWEHLQRAVEEFDDAPWAGQPRDLHPLVELRLLRSSGLVDVRERTEALCRDRNLRVLGTVRLFDDATYTAAPDADRTPSLPTFDLREGSAPARVLSAHWREKFGQDLPTDLALLFEEACSLVATGSES